MSLVYDNVDLTQPQTHALVIGVGDYQYLMSGVKKKPNAVTLGLGQLTSPPVSAKKFADWLIANLRVDSANPLGSVELLISPSPGKHQWSPAVNPVVVDRAEMKNVKTAFDNWEARCNSLKANVAILYYCGHGIERDGILLLLPDDFGENQNRLWENSVDIDGTWQGMRECQAGTDYEGAQLYFLDCCREASIDALQSQPFDPPSLMSGLNFVFPVRNAPKFKAAASGQRAHGPANGLSIFTGALIKCLEGLGAESFDGVSTWTVTNSSLGEAMKRLMARMKLPGGKPTCSIGGESHYSISVHELPDPVEVLADVRCDPLWALAAADLAVKKNGTVVRNRTKDQDPWLFEIPTGQDYDVEADFPSGLFRKAILPKQIVYPPVFSRTLKV